MTFLAAYIGIGLVVGYFVARACYHAEPAPGSAAGTLRGSLLCGAIYGLVGWPLTCVILLCGAVYVYAPRPSKELSRRIGDFIFGAK